LLIIIALIKTAISTFQLYKIWQSQITELDLSPLPEATGKQEKERLPLEPAHDQPIQGNYA